MRHEKAPFIPQIPRMLNEAAAHGLDKDIPESDWTKVITLAGELNDIFCKLEALSKHEADSKPGIQMLHEISSSAAALTACSGFKTAATSISTCAKIKKYGCSKMAVLVGKLGRYLAASNFIVAAARQLSIFQHILVAEVKADSIVSAPIQNSPTTLLESLNRVAPQTPSTKVAEIAKALKLESFDSAERLFQQELLSAHKGRRIHAEIKLTLFYETHRSEVQPRVICSSKSACFLCSLFTKLHGSFYIKRTHGKLYTKWALPQTRALSLSASQISKYQSTVSKLNTAVEETIRLNLQVGKQEQYQPNESVLYLTVPWVNSARSSIVSDNAVAPQVVLTGQDTVAVEVGGTDGSSSALKQPKSTTRDSPKVASSPQPNAVRPISPDQVPLPASESSTNAVDKLPSPSKHEVVSPETQSSQAKEALFGFQLRRQPSYEERPREERSLTRAPLNGKDRAASQLCFSTGSKDLLKRSRPPLIMPQTPSGCEVGHERLLRGQKVCRELSSSGPPLRFRTAHFRLELSSDPVHLDSDSNIVAHCLPCQPLLDQPGTYWISIKWLDHNEVPESVSVDSGSVISLDEQGSNLERVLRHGTARSSIALYLVRKTDIVRVKYHLSPNDESYEV